METTTQTATAGKAGMAAIIETYTADYTGRVQSAQRSDGQWFVRYQERHPTYGYRWTAWRKGFAPTGGHQVASKARLPRKEAA